MDPLRTKASTFFLAHEQPRTPLGTASSGEATRLFAEQGIKATTVAQIEEAVGLRKGSGGVHRYFATKNDLVRAVFDAQLEKGREQLATATELPQTRGR